MDIPVYLGVDSMPARYVVKLDRWGRIYVPVELRRRLSSEAFTAELQEDRLILMPLPRGSGKKLRGLTYYLRETMRDNRSSSSS